MGFLMSVNVVKEGKDDNNINKIEECVVKALDDKYERIDSADDSDRTILIVPNNRFVSIFDDFAPYMYEDQFSIFPRRLSRTLDAPIVSLYVEDGDVIQLRLFQEGQLLDEYCNMPWFVDETVPTGTVTGDAEIWVKQLKLDATPEELESAWSNLDLLGEQVVERLWEIFGGDSSLFMRDKIFFLEDLEQYSLMHFKRKPDVQLGNLEEYMVKLYEQDKLIRKKQRLFFKLFEEVFQPVFAQHGFTRTEKFKHYRIYEKGYSNDSSVILFVQFYELHFSLNIYCKKEECNGLHLINYLYTLEDGEAELLEAIHRARDAFLAEGLQFVQRVEGMQV